MYIVAFFFLIAAMICFLIDWFRPPERVINTTLGFVFVAAGLACWVWWASGALHHFWEG